MVDKFYKLPQDITSRKDLRSSDKLVYSVILDHIGGNNKGWPGIQTLMSKTALARQTVISSIQRLESAGFLEVNRRKRGQSNHYKTSLNIRPLQKPNQSNNCTTGGLKIRPEVVYSLDPNQTDSLNQTVSADSRKFLLSDSRKLRLTDRSGIVGSSDSDSRKSPTLIINNIIYTFVLKNGNEWTLPPGKIEEYRQAFPRLDVESELRKARQWLIDNPARRKTAKGMLRFLSGWLGRAKTTDSNSRERDKGREAGFLDSQTREATPEEADEFLRAAVC